MNECEHENTIKRKWNVKKGIFVNEMCVGSDPKDGKSCLNIWIKISSSQPHPLKY